MTPKPARPFVVTIAIGAIGAGCAQSGAGSPASSDNDSMPSGDVDGHGGIDNPPECPPDDPGFGAKFKPCTAPATVLCSYPDLCDLRPPDTGPAVNQYICHDNGAGKSWTALTSYTPTCPTEQPKDGAPCPCSPHMIVSACVYGTCEGLNRTFSWCQTETDYGQTWFSGPVNCNPPEPDGGLDGDAFDGGDGDAADGD